MIDTYRGAFIWHACLLHPLSFCNCHWLGKDTPAWECNTLGLMLISSHAKASRGYLFTNNLSSITFIDHEECLNKLLDLDKWSRMFLECHSVESHKKNDSRKLVLVLALNLFYFLQQTLLTVTPRPSMCVNLCVWTPANTHLRTRWPPSPEWQQPTLKARLEVFLHIPQLGPGLNILSLYSSLLFI